MGINIKISKKFALTSDKNQFVLNKIRIAEETKREKENNILYKKGDELLFPFAFYSSFESALKSIPDRIVMQSNANSFVSLTKKYQKIIDQILSANNETIRKR